MKPLERLTQRISVRAGIIVSIAMIILALASTSAQRVGPLMNATTAVGIAAATPAAGEPNGTTQTSSGTDLKVGPRSAKEVRGASPLLEIKNEPGPKLIVDPPLPDLMDLGVVLIQWRAENVHIVPVFGKGALNLSPRVGHLHVHMDDLPWLWADFSDINTIDLAGVPPGPHKILIELVNANHEVFPGQATDSYVHRPEGNVSQSLSLRARERFAAIQRRRTAQWRTEWTRSAARIGERAFRSRVS